MNLQKDRVLFAALAILPLLFLPSCSKQPAASPQSQAATPAVDASTPKKASLAFASAMVSGDIAGMRSAAVGTGGHVFAFYASLAETVTAQHQFKAALIAKFGDVCKLPADIGAIGNLNPLPPDYDSLNEKIDGDTATLVDASGRGGLKLKKIGENWKVDFQAADADLTGSGAEQMAQQQEIFAKTKKAFDEVTTKITNGAYSNCQAALDDLISAMPHP